VNYKEVPSLANEAVKNYLNTAYFSWSSSKNCRVNPSDISILMVYIEAAIEGSLPKQIKTDKITSRYSF